MKYNFLFSHYYLKNFFKEIVLSITDVSNVLIDSGAFSAFTLGKEINLNNYIDVCLKDYHGKVWQYIQLDKVRNPEVTHKNLKIMVDRGLQPMPVFTMNDDYSIIPEMVSINPYLCVAGGVKSSDNYIFRRYQQVNKVSEGKAKIHGLGFLRFPALYQLPLYSGDSSSFMSGAMWGKIYLYTRKRGVHKVAANLGKLRCDPKKYKDHIDSTCVTFLKNCNIDVVKEIASDTLCVGMSSVSNFCTINSYINFCNDAEKFYNRKIFLAFANPGSLICVLSVIKAKRGEYYDHSVATSYFDRLISYYRDKNTTALVDEIRRAFV